MQPDARNRGDLSRQGVPTVGAVQSVLPRAADAGHWVTRGAYSVVAYITIIRPTFLRKGIQVTPERSTTLNTVTYSALGEAPIGNALLLGAKHFKEVTSELKRRL
jgi:hypothetical protein